ncbi:MAG TPA: nitrile hydratase accessory protein [Bauldia sp.]|nr:nitrile hydratase accessory protein [Bauldia sp.]
MNRPEEALHPREARAGTPVFAEPWHAQVLAIADGLITGGMFSAAAWADALGAALRDAAKSGLPDDEATYYASALRALEALVAEKAPQESSALPGRVEAWRRAYLNTLHGRPVELAAAERPPLRHGSGDHDHHDHDHP